MEEGSWESLVETNTNNGTVRNMKYMNFRRQKGTGERMGVGASSTHLMGGTQSYHPIYSSLSFPGELKLS